jgi:putative transposase
MPKNRNHYSGQFKFQVALEAVKGVKTINQMAGEYSLHPNLISQWKRQLLEEGSTIFDHTTTRQQQQLKENEAELFEQIGRLKMELEWLKKKAAAFN